MGKSETKKTKAVKRPEDPGRRDFIVIATNAMAGLGAVAVAWPLIDQMNPPQIPWRSLILKSMFKNFRRSVNHS